MPAGNMSDNVQKCESVHNILLLFIHCALVLLICPANLVREGECVTRVKLGKYILICFMMHISLSLMYVGKYVSCL